MSANLQPKPTAAFALSIVAGLITILSAFIFSQSTPIFLLQDPSMASTLQIWGTVAGLLVIVGSWLLYNNAAQRKLGSTLALVFSLISMNIIGLILGLIGGFLGYTYKTTSSNTNAPGRSYNPP